MKRALLQLFLISCTACCAFSMEAQPSLKNGIPLQEKDGNEDETVLRQISRGFARVAKKTVPAVVYIESQTVVKKSTADRRPRRGASENPFDYFNDDFFNRFFGYPYSDEPPKKQSTVRGSGFIVSPDGYIVTNNHVVENAEKITVTLHDGRKLAAHIVGTDPKTELAVIHIEEKKLPYLTFGNSDTLEVGDWTIAVGNPFGLDATVTVGIVSAKGRNELKITDFEDFIQTDAAINPGNSGGPLLNIDGEVIGINTAIVSGSGGYMGIGFAIPSNMAILIKDQLIKDGQVTRGFLGVTLQPIDSELADIYKLDKIQGALVTDVIKDSPADAAGLKQEDIILNYNGTPVESLSGFRNAVSLMAPGSKLILKVDREGKILTLNVTISSLPNEMGPHLPVEKLGLSVQNLTPELAQQLGYPQNKGVVISRVQPHSPAAEAGLSAGALILAINRKQISTVDEFYSILKESSSDRRILLMVKQGEVVRFVPLRFPE